MDEEAGAPDWFWQVIDDARPSLAALAAWLTAQPRDAVARFGRTYQDAASDLADYSTGIEVDGAVWSEDDMEDLCHWVVGRGRAFWGVRRVRAVSAAGRGAVVPE